MASISCIGEVHAGTIRKTVSVNISPNFQSSYKLTVEAYVVDSLTTLLPNEGSVIRKTEGTTSQQPTDPNFNINAWIDMILRAEEAGRKRLPVNISNNRRFTWIVGDRGGMYIK